MTYEPDAYKARPADEQIWLECSGDDYHYGLECLPPAFWEGSRFMVGEPSSHTDEGFPTYQPFLMVGTTYYKGKWPMTRIDFKNMTLGQVIDGIKRGK